MALLHLNFESQYLNNNTDVNIILPDKPRGVTPAQFYDRKRKYPVLWLLHGTFGDYTDWIRKSNIELYACERDVVVVMPSALNSNYLDWKGFGIGYGMWQYLTEELMPLVYNWFPASDKRKDNFIAGLSMGGGGAIQYAVGHPDKFAAAAILSSAPSNHKESIAKNEVNERTQTVINDMGGADAYLASAANTWDKLPTLIKKKALPRLYFAVGKQDFLYDRYEKFKAYAGEIGLDAVFEEYDGFKHEWRFWDLTIQKALDFFGLPNKNAGNAF
jgi:putative tributyrin esterase